MRRAVTLAAVEAAFVVGLWGVYTGGWQKPLAPGDAAIVVLFGIVLVQLDIILELARRVIRYMQSGQADLVSYTKRLEAEYFSIRAENQQLARDLAAAEERGSVKSQFLEGYTRKHDTASAKVAQDVDGKFTAPDGMTREEKERSAYSLHVDGWSNADIAEELQIGSGSVGVYISRGKKSYDSHGDLMQAGEGAYTAKRPEDTSLGGRIRRIAGE